MVEGCPSAPRYGGVADEHGRVDVGGEHGGVQDSCDVEPLAVEPDALSGEDSVDAEALSGQGAEHRDRLPGGGGVEEAAPGHGIPGGLRQAEAGGLHGDGVGVDGRDKRAPEDVDVAHVGGVLDRGDPRDTADHRRGLLRELGGLAE